MCKRTGKQELDLFTVRHICKLQKLAFLFYPILKISKRYHHAAKKKEKKVFPNTCVTGSLQFVILYTCPVPSCIFITPKTTLKNHTPRHTIPTQNVWMDIYAARKKKGLSKAIFFYTHRKHSHKHTHTHTCTHI